MVDVVKFHNEFIEFVTKPVWVLGNNDSYYLLLKVFLHYDKTGKEKMVEYMKYFTDRGINLRIYDYGVLKIWVPVERVAVPKNFIDGVLKR